MQNSNASRFIALAVLVLLSASSEASTKQGSWLLRTDVDRGCVPAPTVETKVRINVTGLIGRTRVVQTFRNPSSEWLEGVYVFPLPERSAGWSHQQTVRTRPQGGSAAQLLAVLAFLLLITGLLIHWSGDKSCKDERSVYSSSP